MAKVKPVPDGFHRVTPHLVVDGADSAIAFYKKAFGATERNRMTTPDGSKVIHAEVAIGDSIVMLADEFPDWGSLSPKRLGGTPVALHLYVADADALFAQATTAGATVSMPLADMFWGDRYGKLTDPFGHSWSVSTHVADPTREEMEAAMKQAFAKSA